MQYSYGVRAALATAVAFLIGAGHASAGRSPLRRKSYCDYRLLQILPISAIYQSINWLSFFPNLESHNAARFYLGAEIAL